MALRLSTKHLTDLPLTKCAWSQIRAGRDRVSPRRIIITIQRQRVTAIWARNRRHYAVATAGHSTYHEWIGHKSTALEDALLGLIMQHDIRFVLTAPDHFSTPTPQQERLATSATTITTRCAQWPGPRPAPMAPHLSGLAARYRRLTPSSPVTSIDNIGP